MISWLCAALARREQSGLLSILAMSGVSGGQQIVADVVGHVPVQLSDRESCQTCAIDLLPDRESCQTCAIDLLPGDGHPHGPGHSHPQSHGKLILRQLDHRGTGPTPEISERSYPTPEISEREAKPRKKKFDDGKSSREKQSHGLFSCDLHLGHRRSLGSAVGQDQDSP